MNPATFTLPNFTHYIIYKYDAMGRRIAKLNNSPTLDLYITANLSNYMQSQELAGLFGGEMCMLLNECGSDATYYMRDANGEVISVFRSYEYVNVALCGHNEFAEWNIYGSEEHCKEGSQQHYKCKKEQRAATPCSIKYITEFLIIKNTIYCSIYDTCLLCLMYYWRARGSRS